MSDFVRLEGLLAAERDAGRAVAVRGDECITRADWLERVRRWYATLRGLEGRRWALYHADAVEFSAILYALWACDKTACVPGSNQPLVVEELAPRVDGFLGEFAGTGAAPCRSRPDPPDDTAPPSGTLDPAQRVLEVFTSGSSGEPKAIPKRLSQLSAEVNNLESLWGGLARDAVTMATVSHHHIYGLLFRVLWPLAAARCFDARPCEYFQQIGTRAQDRARILVVSSPAHLSRLPREMDCETLLSRCRAIFSSGAPLPREAGLRVRDMLGFSPVEVYGSSETGGIAWRAQHPDHEPLWETLPEVAVSVDEKTGCLRVRSPYLPPMPAGAWHTTSDKASLMQGGRFRLLGRVDRIVKIEGKRVSLDEMERRLEAHEWVGSARLAVLNGRRTELGAVVVPTGAGEQALESQGRRPVNIELQKHLHAQFERSVIPRRWRYCEALPVNNQGKTTQPALSALFDGDKPAGAKSQWPQVVNR